ncbi:MAG TPA: cell division protein ZapE [Brevundimonas sp.]|jgi:cell division protein ZapE|uniref:cell division protein ZapE n=1 Tax=Brevundimonas sp. TaxID=1871086 RepID=UPI002DE276CE|nr:cell division protein ZapE [Brevundimonas sp.]
MGSRIRAAYEKRLAEGRLTADPGQAAAIDALSRLEADLKRRGLFGRRPDVRGVYLHGPPGRGKSMLMDLFHACAPEPKLRRHFHVFMAEVHGLIREWREGDRAARQARFGQSKGDDPLAPVADLISRRARLLCFDELEVTDIADALILGRLFQALFDRGTVLAVTSNRAPDRLYPNGINRELFLPFVGLIRERCETVVVSGERDWRIDRLARSRTWFLRDQRPEFEALWAELKGDAEEAPTCLTVLGREVRIDRTVGGVARAGFEALCGSALGPQDWLALAGRFHTLFLEDVPVLDAARHMHARRLVTLIDALYEAGARLVVLAEASPEALYVRGTGAFEFERTVSRLNEMTAPAWLSRTPAGRQDDDPVPGVTA